MSLPFEIVGMNAADARSCVRFVKQHDKFKKEESLKCWYSHRHHQAIRWDCPEKDLPALFSHRSRDLQLAWTMCVPPLGSLDAILLRSLMNLNKNISLKPSGSSLFL